MFRLFRGVAAGTLVSVIVCASCDSSDAPCKVDTDCAQGQICREERCGFPGGPDGSTTPVPEGGVPACSIDGTLCVSNQECCSRNCASGRCDVLGLPPPPCRGLYELCTSTTDCCASYSCTSGACR